ncbi:MAG: hypothetical protein ACSHYF_17020 [Verrucomicrobiaceae bacterium]
MKQLLPLLLLSLASCGIIKNLSRSKPDPNAKPEAPRREVIGRIASVSETGNFVLIQKYGPGSLPKRVLFQTVGVGGSQASLRPTGERVRDFFAADIINGTVKTGDAVITFPLVIQKAESEAQKAHILPPEDDPDPSLD